MITPQSNERRVLIPVRWSGGEWKVLDDSSMPKLAEGTVGELSVPASAFLNPKDTKPYLEESFAEILPALTMLWASISSNHGGPGMNELVRRGLPAKRSHENGYFMVGFLIKEPLVLRLRGTKHASLEPCPCDLPGIPQDMAVSSINQAYTRLSEQYEPQRRSHAGNVFQKVYFESTNGSFKPLEDLRFIAPALRDEQQANNRRPHH